MTNHLTKFDWIIDRHEAEQGEGLRERLEGYLFMLDKSGFDSDKEYAKEIRRRCLAPTTPTKPTEPLAVLADRKGFSAEEFKMFEMVWVIQFHKNGELLQMTDGATYAEAEARAYLEGLADKEGA